MGRSPRPKAVGPRGERPGPGASTSQRDRTYAIPPSIKEEGLSVRTMNRGVAPGRPACAVADQPGMLDIANVHGRRSGTAGYRVAAGAKIAVANREQLGINRAVRVMATCAPFPHRGVLED